MSFRPPKGRFWALAKKELWSHLVSPISYVILLLFYLFKGVFLYRLVRYFGGGGDAELFAMNYLNDQATYLAVILIPPLLTMRSFAEEKRTGSFELLMTAPVQDHEVVLAKWLSSWIFYGILWLPSLLILLVLQSPLFLGASVPMAQVLTGYFGLFALGSLLLSCGILTSSLTDNQLLASLSSMLFGIALLYVPHLLMQDQGTTVDSDFLTVLLEQVYVARHLSQWFFRGLVDTGHLVFYLSTTVLVLFLTIRVVEARKWS